MAETDGARGEEFAGVAVLFAGRPSRNRITGPVRFVGNLLRTWRLERRAAAALLGFEEIDLPYADDVLDGRRALSAGRDVRDRIT